MAFFGAVLLYLRGEKDLKIKAEFEAMLFERAIPLAVAFFVWHISSAMSRIEERLADKKE